MGKKALKYNYITVPHVGGTLKASLEWKVRTKFKKNSKGSYRHPEWMGATVAHNYNSSIYYYVFPMFGTKKQQAHYWLQNRNVSISEDYYLDQGRVSAHFGRMLSHPDFQ